MNFSMSMAHRPAPEDGNAYRRDVQFLRARRLELENDLEALLALEAIMEKQDVPAQCQKATKWVNMPRVDCGTWPSPTLICGEADSSGVPSETLQAVHSSGCSNILMRSLGSCRSYFPKDAFVDSSNAVAHPVQQTCCPLDTMQVQFSETFSEVTYSSSNDYIALNGLVDMILPVRKRLQRGCPVF
jgi:hypothetical protein